MNKRQKSAVKQILTKRNFTSLTDLRTIIFLVKNKLNASVKGTLRNNIFTSNCSWQERKNWINRVLAWNGPRRETIEYQSILYNSLEKAIALKKIKSDKILGANNPAYQHGGRLSPFSDKFIGKCTKEEALAKSRITKTNNPQNENTKIQYYLSRGLNEKDALLALQERQAVGTLDKFIQRHGDEEGLKRWKERQIKWQNTLNNKSSEEKARINSLKTSKGYAVSKAEKYIYQYLVEKIDNVKKGLSLSYNNNKNYYVYDIAVGNKIIEYNGDLWHANPKIYDESFINPVSKKSAVEIWNKEKHKEKVANEHGYEVFRIWEFDYKNDKEKAIEKCMKFLNQ
jgi:hypothetical protein